jgi:hypothetical protein
MVAKLVIVFFANCVKCMSYDDTPHKELITSASRYEIHACLNDLSDHRCIAILAVETNQGHLC